MNNWALKGDVHNKAYDFPATDYDKEGKDMFGRTRMTDVEKLKDEYARCLRAFHQNPNPRLGAVLQMIAAALKKAEKEKQA